MTFCAPLIAVKDVEVSKKFYGELFGQKVAMDHGLNVVMDGGFSLQQDYAWLTGLPADSILERPHNMELYFETDDFDGFLALLKAHPEVEWVHEVKTYDWKQRVIRIYDPDKHIIEVGESMVYLAKKFLAEGNTPEQVAEMIQHPIGFVRMCMQ
ncbi:VOC family protein [Anaeromassilibacillus senegalensis]|uniref:VOC family protein n=1 Tax=Anaeromassilibacillus senegalensis TaxID=1673717 RepID=UPI000682F66C|nr:VOC family protein [Anaeromassilibacillus senegalensis]